MNFNRVEYFNTIQNRLVELSECIKQRGHLNILDYNVHAEYFYRDLFNLLFNLKLVNLNDSIRNAESIDLIDRTNKIIIQVSATNTRVKIQHSLDGIKSDYSEYKFKFISIAGRVGNLRENKYVIPEMVNVSFNPTDDIYDVDDIISIINSLKLDNLSKIHNFIQKELGTKNVVANLESNLTEIINLLSKENLAIQLSSPIAFDPEQKINYNNLKEGKAFIEDYKVYGGIMQKIYDEYDKQGANKSLSVLAKIKSIYIKNRSLGNADEVLYSIINNIKDYILCSPNFNHIPDEELDYSVKIVVVDAFMRCKIFEKPKN